MRGEWVLTKKLDGVKLIMRPDGAFSRAGKPLFNIPPGLPCGEYEVFLDNWETSVSLVRTRNGAIVPSSCLYSLWDIREGHELFIARLTNPRKYEIQAYFQAARDLKAEGLVLHGANGDTLKVKPRETYDVAVIGVQPGEGKHKGRIGALLTEKGKVGTGFTDAQRAAHYPNGTVIEVEAMGLTPGGKFRHPRFVRVRWDKRLKD